MSRSCRNLKFRSGLDKFFSVLYPESPDLISLFVAPLNQLGIQYMVTGSLAAGMYGEARLTNDVDLVIMLSAEDVPRLHEMFDTPAFYVPPLDVIETERRRPRHGHFNVIHNESAYKADVYLVGDDPLHAWAFTQRTQIVVDTTPVWIAPPEYVILRKLQYFRDGGSSKHVTDIEAMLLVLDDMIDRSELRRRIDEYNLGTEWKVVQGQG